MSAKEQARIVELQRALKIARDALTRIAHTSCGGRPDMVADEALYAMLSLERKAPLQGLVGHERRPRP